MDIGIYMCGVSVCIGACWQSGVCVLLFLAVVLVSSFLVKKTICVCLCIVHVYA